MPSVPVITSVDVNDGAAFPVTAIVNICSVNLLGVPSSVTRSVTGLSPTSPAPGVPDSVAVPSPLSTSDSHAGMVGAVMVSVSPTSASLVVME